ncbi:MAG: siderophore-interacting protein [Microbacterium sp.]|uniref:siderophore-interacting protein n=1 Tax=Microbacterium sp. TaxID=51671 RepID=UPI0039E23F3A
MGIFDEGYTYQPGPGAHQQLLVADESALPAVLAILEQATPELSAEVFLEVPTEADIRPDIDCPERTIIHWLPRDNPTLKPGTLALATGVRRHLVTDRHLGKSTITFTGYWRHGHAAPG